MDEKYKQKTSGSMEYPDRGTLNRLLFKTPLIWWRMGLGPVLSHKALGGSKMLALTTWGRKSRKPRHTMLSYVSVGDREYVCSGWGEESDWYKNITINAQVSVQVGRKSYVAKSRRVQEIDEFRQIVQEMFETGGDSHFESWLESYGIAPNQDDMLDKRERLHIVAFDRSDEVGPEPMPLDLKWVWGLIIAILVGAWLLRKNH